MLYIRQHARRLATSMSWVARVARTGRRKMSTASIPKSMRAFVLVEVCSILCDLEVSFIHSIHRGAESPFGTTPSRRSAQTTSSSRMSQSRRTRPTGSVSRPPPSSA